jgi:hypothetical protein
MAFTVSSSAKHLEYEKQSDAQMKQNQNNTKQIAYKMQCRGKSK